jgi:Fe-S-cluster-containing dehydrogenase component
MASSILVDLERCIGCWTCAMACKCGNGLANDDYRVVVRTMGSGAGIDRPAGVYPTLTMGWMPVYLKSCVMCASRVAAGDMPYCVYDCPTQALHFGDSSKSDSEYAQELERLRKKGYRIFKLPAWENSRSAISYATKK